MKYEVIEDIPEGWETTAKKGDILTLEYWGGVGCRFSTLLKEDKAVCDLESEYGKKNVRPLAFSGEVEK